MESVSSDGPLSSHGQAGEGRRVLVFGATGQQGGAVAAALQADGWQVRALLRDPNGPKGRQFADAGVDVVPGDLDDAASVRAAMAGVHGVFSVQPSSGQGAAYGITDAQEIRWGRGVADAALAAGVRHLVYASVNAVGRGPTGMGHFDSKFEIEEYIRSLDLPGTIVRLTAVRHAFETILRPVLPRFLAEHPAIQIDVAIDDGLADIVADRFDASLRLGGLIDKDMIALRVGPDIETAVVGTPDYLACRGVPRNPRDLLDHTCINYRLASSGGLYPWRFAWNGRPLDVRVAGGMTLDDGEAILACALDGVGLAYTFLDRVEPELASGRLVRVLASSAWRYPGYQLYYSSARHVPPALRAFIAALKRS